MHITRRSIMCACDPRSIILIEKTLFLFYSYSRDEFLCSFVSIFHFRFLFVEIENSLSFSLCGHSHSSSIFFSSFAFLLASLPFRISCAEFLLFGKSRLIQCANAFVFLLICFFDVFLFSLLIILDVSSF